jgi:hypothetical protein
MKKIYKSLKRHAALLTLALTDVSKSALANQKSVGIDGAAHSISVSVLSEGMLVVNDMVKGRQTKETQQLASLWWNAHVRMQRMGWIDGVKRELTEDEWRARWEQYADPANADKGPVVFTSELRTSYDENAAVEYAGNKVVLNEEKRQATRKTNVEFTTAKGFYFPLDSVDSVYARRDENEGYTFELHTLISPSDEASYGLALDPDYAFLLTGLLRIAVVQEEYSGLVLRAFAISGPPAVRIVAGRDISAFLKRRAALANEEISGNDLGLDLLPDNNSRHLVLSYPAREALISGAEAKVLFGGEVETEQVA